MYKIDYGCYVDLLTTNKEPKHLFGETEQGVEVPPDDYRAIRVECLDVKEFKSRQGILPLG